MGVRMLDKLPKRPANRSLLLGSTASVLLAIFAVGSQSTLLLFIAFILFVLGGAVAAEHALQRALLARRIRRAAIELGLEPRGRFRFESANASVTLAHHLPGGGSDEIRGHAGQTPPLRLESEQALFVALEQRLDAPCTPGEARWWNDRVRPSRPAPVLELAPCLERRGARIRRLALFPDPRGGNARLACGLEVPFRGGVELRHALDALELVGRRMLSNDIPLTRRLLVEATSHEQPRFRAWALTWLCCGFPEQADAALAVEAALEDDDPNVLFNAVAFGHGLVHTSALLHVARSPRVQTQVRVLAYLRAKQSRDQPNCDEVLGDLLVDVGRSSRAFTLTASLRWAATHAPELNADDLLAKILLESPEAPILEALELSRAIGTVDLIATLHHLTRSGLPAIKTTARRAIEDIRRRTGATGGQLSLIEPGGGELSVSASVNGGLSIEPDDAAFSAADGWPGFELEDERAETR